MNLSRVRRQINLSVVSKDTNQLFRSPSLQKSRFESYLFFPRKFLNLSESKKTKICTCDSSSQCRLALLLAKFFTNQNITSAAHVMRNTNGIHVKKRSPQISPVNEHAISSGCLWCRRRSEIRSTDLQQAVVNWAIVHALLLLFHLATSTAKCEM